MKVLVLFSLLLAVASSYPVVKTWTLLSLSDAIENSKGDPDMMPYLKDALNQIMYALFTGVNEKSIHGVIPSPSGGSKWTVDELKKALADPETKSEYMPALLQANSYVVQKNETGDLPESVEVVIPALDISTWTVSDLNEALKNPSTNADLIPYLGKAQAELDLAIEKGESREFIYMVTPVGLITPKADYNFLLKPSKQLIKKTKKGL